MHAAALPPMFTARRMPGITHAIFELKEYAVPQACGRQNDIIKRGTASRYPRRFVSFRDHSFDMIGSWYCW
jgi:hypothetical protein